MLENIGYVFMVCFHVDKEYCGKEEDVIWPNRQKKNIIEIRMIHVKVEGTRRSGIPAHT